MVAFGGGWKSAGGPTAGVANIVVVSTTTIDPPHHQDIALTELIEQPAALRPLNEACVQARHAIVRHHLVYVKPADLA
jgi:hypothetical protein